MSGTFEKREGTGALFTNDKMTSERSPVMTGYIMYKGEEIRIAGWSKQTSTGKKMLSLSAEPAQNQGENNGNSQPNSGGVTPQPSTTGDVNDAIPF